MYKGQDRRKYKRTKKVHTVSFRIRPDEAQKTVSSSWNTVSSIDLSAGCVLINHDKELAVGSTVDLQINISESTTPINCVGQIVRIEKNTDSSDCKIAIMFTEIGEEERNLINKIAEKS